MPFSYYRRLPAALQAVYHRSNRVRSIRLAGGQLLQPVTARLQAALLKADRCAVERICQQLVDAVTGELSVSQVRVRVLASRPHDEGGELHGLYQACDGGRYARITVWMRTAQQGRVVAFSTFLRTLLHELCHHLDYQYLKLADSLHTEGFFARESSLYRQLVRQPQQQELELA